MFSLWVRFRGGKGVATSAGVFLALAPVAVAGGLVVWMALALTTRIVSVASMGAAAALPAIVALTASPEEATAMVWFTTALGAFVIWAHRTNFRRLLKGQENRFTWGSRRGGEDTTRPDGEAPE
jgi:glycerol-3-phosphate acyltransferase PlsY